MKMHTWKMDLLRMKNVVLQTLCQNGVLKTVFNATNAFSHVHTVLFVRSYLIKQKLLARQKVLNFFKQKVRAWKVISSPFKYQHLTVQNVVSAFKYVQHQ